MVFGNVEFTKTGFCWSACRRLELGSALPGEGKVVYVAAYHSANPAYSFGGNYGDYRTADLISQDAKTLLEMPNNAYVLAARTVENWPTNNAEALREILYKMTGETNIHEFLFKSESAQILNRLFFLIEGTFINHTNYKDLTPLKDAIQLVRKNLPTFYSWCQALQL